MSEPDAVPLPREGEVFFDVRGEARSMRLSWYADSNVAVFSIWQGNRCTGTFRLPFVDLARMVQTLQSGPPAPAHQPPSQPGHGYSATVAAYESAPDAGSHRGHDQRYDYAATARQDPGAAASYQVEQGYPTGQGFDASGYRADQDYAGGQGYGAGHDYGAGRDYGIGHNHAAGQDYGAGSGFAAMPAYGTDQPYGGDLHHPSDPYGTSEPYRGSEPYLPSEAYRATEQYGADEQYRPTEQHSQGESYQPYRHGADQPDHGLPAYSPANYGDLAPYRSEPVATGPTAPRPDDWPPPAVPAPPKRGADSESVPDTPMMNFPSVPARNGPSGYR